MNNLGYHESDPQENAIGFQLDFGHLAAPALDISGILDDPTLKLLNQIYEESKDDLRDGSAGT